MGQPVVHFEIIGKDAERLQSYYSELFGWEIDSDNPMNYGVVSREANVNPDGLGIGGGVGDGAGGIRRPRDLLRRGARQAALAKAESLGGSRIMGLEQVELGLFNDPEGHVVGVVKSV
jgi:predicted enzyme related to lactoylglutathione lyase